MTADIINLNKVRKARERSDDKKRAEENRIRYGRTKAEKDEAAHAERAKDRLLDGAALPPEPDVENEPDDAT
jgi:hypothetical protein